MPFSAEIPDKTRRPRHALPPPHVLHRATRRSLDDVDVVELFAERAADHRATVTPVVAAELPAAVAAALGERGARRLVVPPGLSEEWLPAPNDEPRRHTPTPTLRKADAAPGQTNG